MCLQDALPLAIRRPLERIVVVGPVGLDDEPRLRPEEVRHDPATCEVQRRIDSRVGDAAPQDQIQDGVLELALGRRRAGGDHSGERLPAPLRARPGEHRHERAERGEPEELRLTARPPKPLLTEDACEIEQRALSRRHRDPAPRGDVLRWQVRDAVPIDSRVLRRGRSEHEHVRVPVLPADDVRQRRRREVAQRGVCAAGHHRRQHPSLTSRVGVIDRIGAPVEWMEPAVRDAHRDRIGVQPARGEVRD